MKDENGRKEDGEWDTIENENDRKTKRTGGKTRKVYFGGDEEEDRPKGECGEDEKEGSRVVGSGDGERDDARAGGRARKTEGGYEREGGCEGKPVRLPACSAIRRSIHFHCCCVRSREAGRGRESRERADRHTTSAWRGATCAAMRRGTTRRRDAPFAMRKSLRSNELTAGLWQTSFGEN